MSSCCIISLEILLSITNDEVILLFAPQFPARVLILIFVFLFNYLKGGAVMVILGIDPGIATVGFGVISCEGPVQRAIQYGVITTPPSLPLSVRISDIYNDALSLIDTFKPDAIAVEELFFNTNLKTGISVAHGRGVLLLAGVNSAVPMFEYTPLQVKQSIAGYGRAEKKQVMEMVRRLLKLDAVPRPDDAADALAVALCHARAASSLLNNNGGHSVCSTI